MTQHELDHFNSFETTILKWLAGIKEDQLKNNAMIFELHRSLKLALDREFAYEKVQKGE